MNEHEDATLVGAEELLPARLETLQNYDQLGYDRHIFHRASIGAATEERLYRLVFSDGSQLEPLVIGSEEQGETELRTPPYFDINDEIHSRKQVDILREFEKWSEYASPYELTGLRAIEQRMLKQEARRVRKSADNMNRMIEMGCKVWVAFSIRFDLPLRALYEDPGQMVGEVAYFQLQEDASHPTIRPVIYNAFHTEVGLLPTEFKLDEQFLFVDLANSPDEQNN